MFSTRTPDSLAPNRLAQALEASRRAGRDLIDLTESNPTKVDLIYPPDVLRGLGAPESLIYAPEPLGTLAARRGVSASFAARGFDVPPERIALTASTSEAYSLLFKVLCEPGDEVLVPRPSYPLFEHLTRLDAVAAIPYDLEYHGRWSIDLESVERAASPRARAVLVVHPNNPTGSFVKPDELDRIAALCAARDMAIVADEVFAEYELEPGAARAAARVPDRTDVLTFSLGGLSKSVGLPQVKLGWMAMAGPTREVERALTRIEFACDAYLSVSTPVQIAAGELLDHGADVRRQIQSRVAANYRSLFDMASGSPVCHVMHAEGGWSAILRVPAIESEEEMVLTLLDHEGVLIHPGYFFDFPHEAYVIVSLLVREATFVEGVRRLLRYVDSRGGRT